MLGELIVKQFSGSQGGVGVIVADLTASDAEEADALAYDLVMSALTLAKEGVTICFSSLQPKRSNRGDAGNGFTRKSQEGSRVNWKYRD